MAVMRWAIVAIIVSFVSVAARAQEAKPCPSGHICPVCTEQDGVRSCKVERLGQPELPQATAPQDISPSSAAASLPPEDRACITAAANKPPPVTALGIKGSRALPQPLQSKGRRNSDVYRVTVEIDVSVAAVVRQAENWPRARYRGPQAVTGAVAECGIPESSLKRRSATATGSTVIGCVQSNVQNIRIEEAKRLLESEHVFFPKQ
jgi:hypothetical protein